MKPPGGRRFYILLGAAVAAIATLRYIVLVHTASSSLASFFGNGFCTPNNCTFYLEAKGILRTINARINATRIETRMLGYGVPIDGFLEAKLWRLDTNTYRILVKTSPHTYIDYRVRARHCNTPGNSSVQLIDMRKLVVRARTVTPVELRDVIPTASYAYAIMASIYGSCSLSIKLYAFQDHVAWEVVYRGQPSTTTIIIPVGGALDVKGYGPEYTKLILVNYSEDNCTATIKVYRVPTARIDIAFEDYNVTLSLPFIASLQQDQA